MEALAQTRSQGLGLTREVRAAGGVPVHRGEDGGLEVLLVYRRRYGDWTFPKGKVAEGETDEDAARREVEEETSLECDLGAELPSTTYPDPRLRRKTVRYWVMRPRSGEAAPANEIDDVAWLSRAAARERLSYARDREVLDAVPDR